MLLSRYLHRGPVFQHLIQLHHIFQADIDTGIRFARVLVENPSRGIPCCGDICSWAACRHISGQQVDQFFLLVSNQVRKGIATQLITKGLLRLVQRLIQDTVRQKRTRWLGTIDQGGLAFQATNQYANIDLLRIASQADAAGFTPVSANHLAGHQFIEHFQKVIARHVKSTGDFVDGNGPPGGAGSDKSICAGQNR